MAENAFDRTDAMLKEIERLLAPVDEPHPYIGAGPECRRCGRLDSSPLHTGGSQTLNAMTSPFVCENCGATFVSHKGYKKHFESCPFICGLCGKRFSERNEYQRHCWKSASEAVGLVS